MSHNRKVLEASQKDEQAKCICRNMRALDGACRYGPVIYRATVEHSVKNNEGTSTKAYVESIQEFRPRFRNHEAPFREEDLEKYHCSLKLYMDEKYRSQTCYRLRDCG